MIKKYSFIPVVAMSLCSLAWWSAQIENKNSSILGALIDNRSGQMAGVSGEKEALQITERRRGELIEALDKLVAYEHYYHSVYGHFTKVMNRIGFEVPSSVTDFYDVRVAEASSDKLLVTALSEHEGKAGDLISIDQDFQVHSNFDLPPPRVDYVKNHAIKHLRILNSTPSGQLIAEQGIFKGYFQYVEKTGATQRTFIAQGVRAPVEGILIDLEHLAESSARTTSMLGQWKSGKNYSQTETGLPTDPLALPVEQKFISDRNLEEETYLAQKIFLGEMGRYAKTWSELEKIAHFRFEGKEQLGTTEAVVNKPDTESNSDVSSSTGRSIARKITSDSSGKSLEIEPIGPE